jgi:hypothetical protein
MLLFTLLSAVSSNILHLTYSPSEQTSFLPISDKVWSNFNPGKEITMNNPKLKIDRDPFDHKYLIILLTGDLASIPDYLFGGSLDELANIVKSINNTVIIDQNFQHFSQLFPNYQFEDSKVIKSFKNEMIDLYKTTRDLDTLSLNHVKIMSSFTNLDLNSQKLAKTLRDSLITNVN